MSTALDMHESGEVQLRPVDRSCYVLKLWLHARSFITQRIDSAECLGVDDEVSRMLVQAAEQAWTRRRFSASRLVEIWKELGEPNLAVVQGVKAHPQTRVDIPAPNFVPFEPVELDESHTTLQGMVESILDGQPADVHRPKRADWFTRWQAHNGFAGWLVLFTISQGSITTALHVVRSGFNWIDVGMHFIVYATILIVSTLILWRRSAAWFIVPGGLMRRRTFWKGWGIPVERWTPADTLLILKYQQGNLRLLLHPKVGASQRKLLTQWEAIALLAAWQSPITPRPIESMCDLL